MTGFRKGRFARAKVGKAATETKKKPRSVYDRKSVHHALVILYIVGDLVGVLPASGPGQFADAQSQTAMLASDIPSSRRILLQRSGKGSFSRVAQRGCRNVSTPRSQRQISHPLAQNSELPLQHQHHRDSYQEMRLQIIHRPRQMVTKPHGAHDFVQVAAAGLPVGHQESDTCQPPCRRTVTRREWFACSCPRFSNSHNAECTGMLFTLTALNFDRRHG